MCMTKDKERNMNRNANKTNGSLYMKVYSESFFYNEDSSDLYEGLSNYLTILR